MTDLKRPEWPRPGASAAVFRDGAVLLVERGKTHGAGQWSLPGGHIEPGETAAAAALREVREETGIAAAIVGLAGIHDALIRNGEGVLVAHYVLAVFAARAHAGEPIAASDARRARFVPLEALGGYALTPGAADLIGRARALMEDAG